MKKRIESLSVRKGAWSHVEDELLRACVRQYGEGKWHLVPSRAGLKRCRKSCRLRWLNYLKPNIKRGVFAEDEVDLIIRLHTLLGNRWSLIAGRLPGRTPNDVKNYWNTYLRRKLAASNYKENHKNIANAEEIKVKPQVVIKPQPRTFSSRISTWLGQRSLILSEDIESGAKQCSTSTQACEPNLSKYNNCWGNVTEDKEGGNDKCNNNWDDEQLASLTQHVGDYLIDGPSWNDFHLDVNLWDS